MAKSISRDGHRQRLRDSYIENGISAMPAHNVLELLLTYSIPRRDVKSNAYSLLNKFGGSLEKVFNASFDELKKTEGTGECSAALIKLFSEIFNRLEHGGNCVKLDNYVMKKDFVTDILSGIKSECYLILFLNNSDEITSYLTFPQSGDSALPDAKSVVDGVIKNNAPAIIVAHKSNADYHKPSDEDIKFINALKDLLSVLKIQIDDYILVGENGSLSMANDFRYYMYLERK